MLVSRSVSNFELNLVKKVRSVSRFIFFASGCPVVPTPFVEKTLCSIVLLLLHCQRYMSKIFIIFMCIYFWALYSEENQGMLAEGQCLLSDTSKVIVDLPVWPLF